MEHFFCGINKKILIRSSNLEIMSYGFPNEKKKMGKLKKNGLVHLRYTIAYPMILLILFLLTILDET